MSQILTAVTNSSGQVVKAQAHWAKPGAAPARLAVQAGQTIILQVDGERQTGNIPIMGKRPVLRKSGKDLAVDVDGKPVLVLLDFYAAKGVALYGDEWAFAPGHGLGVSSQGVLASLGSDIAAVGVTGTGTGNPKELAAVGLTGTGTGSSGSRDVAAVGVSGTTRDVAAVGVSGTTRDVAAVGVSGTTRDVAAVGVSGTTRDVAAVGVSGTTRDVAAVGMSGTNMEVAAVGLSGTKMAALAAGISLIPLLGALGKGGTDDSGGSTSSLSGSVVAGPVTGGLKVQVFKVENGNLVSLGVADVGSGGQWSLTFKNHTGPVVVRVLDANDTADQKAANYISEIDGQAVDLNVALLAMVNVKQGSNTLNITPVTTIAALKAGIAVDAAGEVVKSVPTDFTAARVDDVNLAVAKALSLSNIVTGEVSTTVNSGGQYVYNLSNQYGKMLAAIEGAGGNNQDTLETIAGLLDVNGKTAVMSMAGMRDLMNGASNVDMRMSPADVSAADLSRAVSAMVSTPVSDTQLSIAGLGNNIITDDTRGTITLRVTAPARVTALVVSINGEPLDSATNPAPTSDGNGNWTVNLNTQAWPYGAHELMVQTMVGDVVDMTAKQMLSVIDTTPAEPDPSVLTRIAGESVGRLVEGAQIDDLVRFLGQNTGNFTVQSGAGNDTIELSRMTVGQNQLKLGEGDDHVKAAAMTVGLSVWDGAGSDSIVLGSGNDTVYADATPGAGVDTFFGRQGTDRLAYAAFAEAVSFNFYGKGSSGGKSGTARSGGANLPDKDFFYGFEDFVGGTGNDTFYVNENAGVGGASYQGGAGNDSLHYAATTAIHRVAWITNSNTTPESGVAGSVLDGANIDAFDGFETVTLGGLGNDTFNIASTTTVTVNGGAGNDSFNLTNSANSVVNGSLGDDVFVATGGSNLTLSGAENNDAFLISNLLNSVLNGGIGDDTFTMTSGSGVTLNGGDGNDAFIVSGTAVAVLNGGNGNDVFTISSQNNVTVNGGATGTGNDSIALVARDLTSNGGGLGNTRINGHDWATDSLSLKGFWGADQINADTLASFVRIAVTSGVVNLQVDLDGSGTTYAMTTIADLTGHANFSSLAALYDNGTLIITG
jgi:hypothetical protein